jgi:predicted ester cyclase
MSTEENKTLMRRGYEALNERNLAIFDELATPDFVFHNASMRIEGLEAFKQFFSMWILAFPDLHFTIHDIIAEGEAVVVRHTARGTHQGELMGIAPTGKQVTSTGIVICHVVNGKAVAEWMNADTLGILQQIGAIPSMG